MKVKSKLLFGIGILLIAPLVYLLLDRTEFALASQQTIGTIENISSHNDSCGRRRSRHDCTVFNATLKYEIAGVSYRINVTAGRARGHNQPTSASNYWIGQPEQVAYDPRHPTRAYRDTVWDIWGMPIGTFFAQIFLFLASFAEKRKED